MKFHLGLALIIGAATSTLGAQEYCNSKYKPFNDKDIVFDLSKLNRFDIFFLYIFLNPFPQR